MSHPQTAISPTRRRLSIFITAAATLVSALFVAVVPGTAAQADPVRIVYCEEHRLPDGRLIIPCWRLNEVFPPLFPDPPCLSCPPYAIQFKWTIDVLDPSLVVGGLHDGLRSLIAASAAADPKERDAYRAAAWKSYETAAANLGKADLSVGEIWRHYKDGYGDPEPQPNRSLFEQFGNETILGLDLLRAALADPDKGAQFQQEAEGAFDRAAAAFTKAMQAG